MKILFGVQLTMEKRCSNPNLHYVLEVNVLMVRRIYSNIEILVLQISVDKKEYEFPDIFLYFLQCYLFICSTFVKY